MKLNIQEVQSSRKDFNADERSITHYISTKNVDSYKEILTPEGFDDTKFKAVLWQHSTGYNWLEDTTPPPSELIIGKNAWFQTDTMGVIAKTIFANTPLGNDVMAFNRDGLLNSWSVGWLPKGDKEYNEETGVTTFKEWYCFEYSSVIFPANNEAVNLENYNIMVKEAISPNFKTLVKSHVDYFNIKSELSTYKSDLDEIKQLLKDVKGTNSENIENRIKEIENKLSKPVLGTVANTKHRITRDSVVKMFGGAVRELTGRK